MVNPVEICLKSVSEASERKQASEMAPARPSLLWKRFSFFFFFFLSHVRHAWFNKQPHCAGYLLPDCVSRLLPFPVPPTPPSSQPTLHSKSPCHLHRSYRCKRRVFGWLLPYSLITVTPQVKVEPCSSSSSSSSSSGSIVVVVSAFIPNLSDQFKAPQGWMPWGLLPMNGTYMQTTYPTI